jgi:CheY-like chemotaxis protein
MGISSQQHPNEIRLLLGDLVMPVMDGGELAERHRELVRLPRCLRSHQQPRCATISPRGNS